MSEEYEGTSSDEELNRLSVFEIDGKYFIN